MARPGRYHQYHVCSAWKDGDAHDVEVVAYHDQGRQDERSPVGLEPWSLTRGYLTRCCSPGQGYEPLAETLGISLSTAHQAVQQLMAAGLVGQDRQVRRRALVEFLIHGVRYAFFAEPGPEVRGVPTAHAGPPLAEEIVADDKYVWPSARGDVRGAAIPPHYDGAPELADRAPELYRALTLVDALRVGRTRQRELAREMLEAWLEETGHAP